MEYVKERASLYELTKTVKAWERKVEIAEVTLASTIVKFKMIFMHHYGYLTCVLLLLTDGSTNQPTDMAPSLSTGQATDGANFTLCQQPNTRPITTLLKVV